MKDRTGRENPGAFKPGEDPRRNAGGVSKGARMSSAVLRVLNLPAGSVRKKKGSDGEYELSSAFIKQHGLTRTEADAAAEHIVALMRSTDPRTALTAFRAIGRLTEGDKLTLGGSVDTNLKGMPIEDLFARKAALMKQFDDARKPVRPRSRK